MPDHTEYNSTITKIRAMQAKWGLSQRNLSKKMGDKLNASDVNTLVDLVNEGKKKSGWSGTVSNKVNVGDIIRNVILNLGNEADAVTRHCPCNCNHCSCNCNRCGCNCDRCYNCGSDCDSDGGGGAG